MKILIHASLDFKPQIITAASTLTNFGCEILLPDLTRYQHIRDRDGDRERFNTIKRRLQRENGDNVAAADVLLILNLSHRGVENYVGGNSFYEMAIAFYLEKPIMLTHAIPADMAYTEEIEAFGPRIIGPIETLTAERWAQHASSAGIRQ